MDLFDGQEILKKEILLGNGTNGSQPLAVRMRPCSMDDFVGQEHLLGTESILTQIISKNRLCSMIFYGPSGTGKTSLAQIIAKEYKASFSQINAVLAGVKDIRAVIQIAQKLRMQKKDYILFIDEIHRFNKSQQDALLPFVEDGLIILIGATTENPYFEINQALLSRCQVFQFKPLTFANIQKLIEKTLSCGIHCNSKKRITLSIDALVYLIKLASGDARIALNILEIVVSMLSKEENEIQVCHIENTTQTKKVNYDKKGDQHYDVVSAFIKSIRGSHPDAALYWLAKMIHSGEDLHFIFRRMLILASEDIGLSNSDALQVVLNCAKSFDYVGMPEGQYHLAHACLYLSTSSKSNSVGGYFQALEKVKTESLSQEVPINLREKSYQSSSNQHYLNPHDFPKRWVEQQYMPSHLGKEKFYYPSNQGVEMKIHQWLTSLKNS